MNIILVLLFALIGVALILFMVTLPYCRKCRSLAEEKDGNASGAGMIKHRIRLNEAG